MPYRTAIETALGLASYTGNFLAWCQLPKIYFFSVFDQVRGIAVNLYPPPLNHNVPPLRLTFYNFWINIFDSSNKES